MKWHLMVALALLVFPGRADAEIEIAAGSGSGLSLPAGGISDPEGHLSLLGDLLLPLGEEWSLFADVSGRLRYGLADGLWDALGSAGADASYRTDMFYARMGASFSAAPGAAEAAGDLLLSLDTFTFCASLLPHASMQWGDDPRTELGLSLASTLSLSDEWILRPALTGDVFWRDPVVAEYSLAAAVGFSWYPGPVVVSLDAGYARRISDLSATVDVGTASLSIPRFDSFHEVTASPSATFALGRSSSMTVTAPMELRFMDHGAVLDGSLAPEAEWILSASPKAAFSWGITDAWNLRIAAGAEIVVSNSPYLRKTVLLLEGEVACSIDEEKLFSAK